MKRLYKPSLGTLSLLCGSCLALTVASCTSKEPEGNLDLDKVAYKVELPDHSDSTNIKYSELFSDVKYIHLDAPCDDAIVGSISKIMITNDNELVVLDCGQENKQKIVRFDSEGHFLNKIGENGHGPNEYTTITNAAYDPFENQIIVYDWGSQKYKFYSLEGKMTKSLNVKYTGIFEVLDKDHFIFFDNYAGFNDKDNFVITNREGEKVTSFEHIPDASPCDFLGWTRNRMAHTEDGSLLCNGSYSSILFKVSSGKVQPYIEFIPKTDDWSICRPEDYKTVKDNCKSYITWFFMHKGKLHIKANYMGASGQQFLYITDLHEYTHGGKSFINDIDQFHWNPNELATFHNKGKLYFYAFPESFEWELERDKEYSRLTAENKKLAQECADAVNPTIQVCTLK